MWHVWGGNEPRHVLLTSRCAWAQIKTKNTIGRSVEPSDVDGGAAPGEAHARICAGARCRQTAAWLTACLKLFMEEEEVLVVEMKEEEAVAEQVVMVGGGGGGAGGGGGDSEKCCLVARLEAVVAGCWVIYCACSWSLFCVFVVSTCCVYVCMCVL